MIYTNLRDEEVCEKILGTMKQASGAVHEDSLKAMFVFIDPARITCSVKRMIDTASVNPTIKRLENGYLALAGWD